MKRVLLRVAALLIAVVAIAGTASIAIAEPIPEADPDPDCYSGTHANPHSDPDPYSGTHAGAGARVFHHHDDR